MKIKLIEKRQLNEAFSPSMPKWLKNKLLKDTVSSGNRNMYYSRDDARDYMPYEVDELGNKQVKYSSNVPGYNDIADSSFPKSARTNKDGTKDKLYNLFQAFRDAEFNMDSATFIEDGDIPTKGSDPRLKEPNIPIFLLKAGNGKTQVYAKGFNDKELDWDTDKQFGYIPMKTILEKCVSFCYVDGSDPKTFTNGKMSGREKNARELNQGDYFRQNQLPKKSSGKDTRNNAWDNGISVNGDNSVSWNTYEFDKSGFARYTNIKNHSKYTNKLAEMKAYKAADWVKECYEQLTNYKNDIAEYMFSSSPEDIAGATDSGRYYPYKKGNLIEAFDILKDAISSYNSLCALVDDGDIERIKYAMTNGEGRRLKNYLDTLKQKTSEYRTSVADWD